MLILPNKEPIETVSYLIDWSDRLATDTISGSPTITVTGATLVSQSNTANTLTIKISGGVAGTIAKIDAHANTAAGNTIDDLVLLPIGTEPISLDQAKKQCRVDGSDDDATIAAYIRSAREYAEQYCGVRLIQRAETLLLPRFFDLASLPAAPIQSVASIKYLDPSGAEQTLDPAVYEAVLGLGDGLAPLIRLKPNQQWPAQFAAVDAVRVAVISGYDIAPMPVIQAMLLLISQWYDNRAGIAVDVRGVPTELPHAVTWLLANFRR